MEKIKAMISDGKIKVSRRETVKETFNLEKSTIGQLEEMITDWDITKSEGVDFIVSAFYALYRGNLEIDVDGYKEFSKESTKVERKIKKKAKLKTKSKKKKRAVTVKDYWKTGTKEELYEIGDFELRYIAKKLGIKNALRYEKNELIEMIMDIVPEVHNEDIPKKVSNVYSFMDYERKIKVKNNG